jgi:hypothetical protein
MRIKIKHTGSFQKTDTFLKKISSPSKLANLNALAMLGVNALSLNTPKDTGETANSWGYEIKIDKSGIRIFWTNYNDVEGVPLVILLQYGHATKDRGYVQGKDFINPAMRPIFDRIEYEVWKEVLNA